MCLSNHRSNPGMSLLNHAEVPVLHQACHYSNKKRSYQAHVLFLTGAYTDSTKAKCQFYPFRFQIQPWTVHGSTPGMLPFYPVPSKHSLCNHGMVQILPGDIPILSLACPYLTRRRSRFYQRQVLILLWAFADFTKTMYLFYNVHRQILIPASKEINKWSAVLFQLSVHKKVFIINVRL